MKDIISSWEMKKIILKELAFALGLEEWKGGCTGQGNTAWRQKLKIPERTAVWDTRRVWSSCGSLIKSQGVLSSRRSSWVPGTALGHQQMAGLGFWEGKYGRKATGRVLCLRKAMGASTFRSSLHSFMESVSCLLPLVLATGSCSASPRTLALKRRPTPDHQIQWEETESHCEDSPRSQVTALAWFKNTGFNQWMT